MGHPLDAEHISALLRATGKNVTDWHAVYWYAAAHEDTVCDASQLTRASTLHAEEHGAIVWISQGKHASFLDEELCRHGCGGDRCHEPGPMSIAALINLGELKAPMNGATWIASPSWPLSEKMERSDFHCRTHRASRTASRHRHRVGQSRSASRTRRDCGQQTQPSTEPSPAALSPSDALVLSNRRTDTALVLAGNHTGNALSETERSTSNAVGKSYRNVRKALGSAARRTGGRHRC